MNTLRVDLRDAVSIGSGPERTHRRPAMDHVPGATIRGALAALWIAEHGEPQSTSPSRRREFVELFESEIRYAPLLPIGAMFEALSALVCKYRSLPGAHTVRDLAFEKAPETCVCGGPLIPAKGGLLARTSIERIEHTRVALETVPPTDGSPGARRERARRGSLYTREALAPDSCLEGPVIGRHTWLESLTDEPIWLGGRRSVQGNARVSWNTQDDEPMHVAAHSDRLVLRCTSPTVLIDDATRSVLHPGQGELQRLLGVDARVVQRWVRPIRVGGWHIASGLPRPEELAVSAGSTFVVALESAPTADALAALCRNGIGIRRNEGFGFVDVVDEAWRPPALPDVAETAASASPALAAVQELNRLADGSPVGRREVRAVALQVVRATLLGRPPVATARLDRLGPELVPAIGRLAALERGDLDDLVALLDAPPEGDEGAGAR